MYWVGSVNWHGIWCLTEFVSGSKITRSDSSSGNSVSPDLEVVDPAVKTGEVPAEESSPLILWSVLRPDSQLLQR